MLLEFSSFISVKYVYNAFLTKVQQSYCYTKLCNYIEEFVLKLISNIPNILVCCNKFHYVLKCFLLSNAWVNFSRLNTIKKWKIVSSFSSLILHAVNILPWKKIITVSRPLNTKPCPAGLSPRIICLASPLLPKMSQNCCTHQVWIVPPSPKALWETLGMGKNPTQQPKIYSFPPSGKSPSIDLNIFLSKVSFLPHQTAIFK